jgi:hypothetical protein
MVPKGHATKVSEGSRDEAVARFLAECTVEVQGRTPVKAIWAAWRGWAKANQVVVGRVRDFTRSLESRGIAIVSYDGTAFAVDVGIASGATTPCRYCRRLIVVGQQCDCRVGGQLDGWEGPGAKSDERGARLPPNRFAEPSAKWAKTAPEGAGLRVSGELKAKRRVDRKANMDELGHDGAHRTQRTPGESAAAIACVMATPADR